MSETLKTALLLRSLGVSTIPVHTDKRPIIPWKDYQTRIPSEEELKKWFSLGAGIAVCAGKIQCIDFDEKYAAGILSRFAARAEETGLDFLLGELIRQATPSGGYHLIFRCDGKKIGNEKLASRPSTAEEVAENNHLRKFSMIETRGEGGYFLIAPSPGYTLEKGDWSSIPLISEDDRDALLSLARSFDERVPQEPQEPNRTEHSASPELKTGLTPGDDYDLSADLPGLLKSHGWKSCGTSEKYWTRPGKTKGISASWNVVPGRFFVFSSSTQFSTNHIYRPWHVYSILECGGDFHIAAAELRRQGFGGSRPKKITTVQDFIECRKINKNDRTITERFPDDPPGIEPCPDDDESPGFDPFGEAPTVETERNKIRRLLYARAFDPEKIPPPIRPIFSLGGVVICTPGNLTAITAPAKVGKSALVSALAAAALTKSEVDTLSAVGYNSGGKALIYFDTEQSPDDFWHAVHRAKRRSGRERLPSWLRAYTVADFPAVIARKALSIAMSDFAAIHRGIHCVIIDGVADLVLDVNDAAECNGLVAELHGLAIRYDCAILSVIHKNPGSEKVRGHLGSQLERKAETNLSLEKEGEVTIVWSAKQRRAPIPRETGPRFRWDDDLRMHVSVAAENRPAAKVMEFRELAESVLKPGENISWRELVGALTEARRTPDLTPSLSTVERWIRGMKKAEIVKFEFGKYRLNSA